MHSIRARWATRLITVAAIIGYAILALLAASQLTACGGGGDEAPEPPLAQVTARPADSTLAITAPGTRFTAVLTGPAAYTNTGADPLELHLHAQAQRTLHTAGPGLINAAGLLAANVDGAGWLGTSPTATSAQALPGADATWQDCFTARLTLPPGSTVQAALMTQLAAFADQPGQLTTTAAVIRISVHRTGFKPQTPEACQ